MHHQHAATTLTTTTTTTTSMPSGPLPPPRPPPPPLLPILLSLLIFLTIIFIITFILLRRRRRRPLPTLSQTGSREPVRFTYSTLRRATASFSPSRFLGQGATASVFSATITTTTTPPLCVAVKLLDPDSLQSDRDFHTELLIASKTNPSPHIVSLLGFASDRKPRRMCLVFELMENGSLQDCLFGKKKGEGMMLDWGVRVRVAIDIAKGLEFLHHECEPGIIHGDLKPSNVLIGGGMKAKIGDFGLARFKVGGNECSSDLGQQLGLGLRGGNGGNGDDAGSVGETESVVTTTTVGFDDGSVSVVIGVDRSPEGNVGAEEASPGMVTMSDKGRGQVGEDVEANEKEVVGKSGEEKGGLGLSNVGSGSRKVKDYVMEWIGSEVRKERPLGGWIGGSSSKAAGSGKMEKKIKKGEKRPEWWVSMDEEKGSKKEKRKTVREWWKEEYVEELERKNKKKKKRKNEKEAVLSDGDQDNWWPRDDAMCRDRKKSRSRTTSRGSLDWWLDGLGSDHGKFRGSNYDSGSGEIPRSGGLSSTPSMRGTVCYIAPEYSAGGDLSEKCDVYSYGVLLLVLIAGRRPLQVTSPVSEYRRANLISWARRLARKGRLLDLVDKRVHSLNTEQAQLFITVALVCLQKSPGSRPSMKEVVGMLTGELDPPVLPMEFTPSPPSRLPYKPQKTPR